MDPAGLLLSVASIAITIDQLQESYNSTYSTLSLIRSQIKILEAGVQRIQEWMHWTDPSSKAQVVSSLQDAILTVNGAVERLQVCLSSIIGTGPATTRLLGRTGSDQWTKTKFAYNEPFLRKHLTDVRECVSLIQFTLSVCQLPVGQSAAREIRELEMGAKTLNRAHTSARRQRESILKEQDHSSQAEKRSTDFDNFMRSVANAEEDLPAGDDTSSILSGDTTFSDLDTSVTLQRDLDELYLSGDSPVRPGHGSRSYTQPQQNGNASYSRDQVGRARQASLPYPVHSSEYSTQRRYPGFTSNGSGTGYLFSGNGDSLMPPTRPPKLPNTSASGSSQQISISRKPVGRKSVSEGSVIINAANTDPATSSPRSDTDNLFNQVSRSLTHLTGDDDTRTITTLNGDHPPPYVDVPSSASSPVRDRKFSQSQAESPAPNTVRTVLELVRDNDINALRGLLKDGVSADEIDPFTRRTPLMEAASLHRSGIATLLVKAGCRLHLKDGNGNTPLHLAGSLGDTETCRVFLEAGALVDDYDAGGDTPLSLAARGGHTDTVLCLLNSWNSQKSTGNALLKGFLGASKSGNVSTAEAFVERGIKPKKVEESWRPVAYAAQSGSSPMIDFMLSHKCNLKERSPDGWTALHFAAKEGHTALVEKLLALKLSWKAQTKKSKETALHLATISNHASTVMALILHKDANITVKDADGQQAIHHAVRNGNLGLTTTILNLFVNRGAKIDETTEYGYTPMLLAAAYGQLQVVADLITRGASIEEKLGSPSFKTQQRTNEAARKGYWAEIRWPHAGARPLHLVSESARKLDYTLTRIITGTGVRAQRCGQRSYRRRCQDRRKRLGRLAAAALCCVQRKCTNGRIAARQKCLTSCYNRRWELAAELRLP